MGGLFGGGKPPNMPAPAPPPPPPTIDQAAQQQDTQAQLRARRGAASNVLAGNNPQAAPTLGVNKLLGQ